MSTGNPQFSLPSSPLNTTEIVLSQKEMEWDKKRAEIEEIADTNGRGLEEGIKDTVTAFNITNITTTQSCEGHPEIKGSHRPWPWVAVAAPYEPEERFVGEKEAFISVATEHGVPLEELRRGTPEDLYWEVQKQVSQNEATPEYQEWEKKNYTLHTNVVEFLNEFYRDRKVDDDVKLKVETYDGGAFEVRSEDMLVVEFLDNKFTDEEKRRLLELLPTRQKEMQDFTSFLKARFLEGKENKLMELIENSTLDIDNRVELALLILDRKQGVQLGNFQIAESEGDKRKVHEEFSKELADILKLLNELGLRRQIVKALSDDDGIIGFSVLTSKDQSILDRFVQANNNNDDKTFGLIVGYPPTAVETYQTDKKFDIESELPAEDLEKLRAEGVLPFLLFMPSREHWPEELEWARENQRLIKEKAPNLYKELSQAN